VSARVGKSVLDRRRSYETHVCLYDDAQVKTVKSFARNSAGKFKKAKSNIGNKVV